MVIDEQDEGLDFSRHADQKSDFGESEEASATNNDAPYDESYPAREYYDAEYEDDDFADFLSQTDDDDEFDPFPAPPARRPEDVDRIE